MTKTGHYSCADTQKSKDLLVHVIKTYHWSRGIAPLIVNLNTRWKCVFISTPTLLYLPGKNPSTQRIGSRVGPDIGLDVQK
jgi:hypothetical protein